MKHENKRQKIEKVSATAARHEHETGEVQSHDRTQYTTRSDLESSTSPSSSTTSSNCEHQVKESTDKQNKAQDELDIITQGSTTASSTSQQPPRRLTEPVFIDKNQQHVQRTDKSCQVCRDRRVKCGREWPICTRCKKRRENCTYGDGITVEVQDTALIEDPRIAQLQGKLAHVEKQLKLAQAQAQEARSQSQSRATGTITRPLPFAPTVPPSTLSPATAGAAPSANASSSNTSSQRRSISVSASPQPSSLSPGEIVTAVQESISASNTEEQDTLLRYLVSHSMHDHSLNSSDNLDWRLARPRMGELLTFHLLDASVFACCSRLVSFKPLISRIDYYKRNLHSLTPTDEAAVAVLCAIGARSSPHSAILGLSIPGLANGTAPPAVYLSVGTRRESACRALSQRAQQVAWLGGVIEGASGWEGQALGPGLARTGTDSHEQRQGRRREATSSSSTSANGGGGGSGGVTDAESASASAGSSRTQARRRDRKERALLAKEKREAVEMLCGLSQVLIFDEVRPRKSRFFLRNAIGMFQDLQIDMTEDEVVELRRSVGLSLFGEDAVHSAQLLKPPLVSQADIDSHFAQTDLQLPDFDRDRLSQSLEQILATNHPSEVSLPMLEKALWTTAIWVCYLQRTFAKLTTVRQPTMPSPLEQLQALWHQIDTTHASVQKLQNYFVNIRHTPQGAEQDVRATDHFVLLAVRADTRLVDIVFLMHGFLMREDVTSGWGLGTQAESDMVARMRVESEMRVRKCLKLVAFYSRLYLSSEDKHVVHHLTLQMELLPTWTFMAVQTVGQPGGPLSSEFEVSDEELDWLLAALRLALFYTPLAAVRLQELTAGESKRARSSSGHSSMYDSRQTTDSPPSPWLPMTDQVQGGVQQWQQQQQQQQRQQQPQSAPQPQYHHVQGGSSYHQPPHAPGQYLSDGGYYYPQQDYNNPALYPAPANTSPPNFQRHHSLSSLPEPSTQQFQAQVQQHQRNTRALDIPYTNARPSLDVEPGGFQPGPGDHDAVPRGEQRRSSGATDSIRYPNVDDSSLLHMAYPANFVFDAYGFPRAASQANLLGQTGYHSRHQRVQQPGDQYGQAGHAQGPHITQRPSSSHSQQQQQQQQQRQSGHGVSTYPDASGHSAAPRATAATTFGGGGGSSSRAAGDGNNGGSVLPSEAFKGQSWMDLAFTRAASSGAWGRDVRSQGTEATADMVEDLAGATEDDEGQEGRGEVGGQGSGTKQEGDGEGGSVSARRWSQIDDPQATSLQVQWGQAQYDIQPPELW